MTDKPAQAPSRSVSAPLSTNTAYLNPYTPVKYRDTVQLSKAQMEELAKLPEAADTAPDTTANQEALLEACCWLLQEKSAEVRFEAGFLPTLVHCFVHSSGHLSFAPTPKLAGRVDPNSLWVCVYFEITYSDPGKTRRQIKAEYTNETSTGKRYFQRPPFGIPRLQIVRQLE